MFEVCFQRRMLRYNRSMFRKVRAQQMIESRYDTVHRIPENCDVVHVVLEEWPDLGFCVNSIGEMPSHGGGIGPALVCNSSPALATRQLGYNSHRSCSLYSFLRIV